MANKIFDLCDEIFHNKNLKRIKENLLLNSFPERFTNKYINSYRKKWYNMKNNISSEIIEKEPIVFTKTIIKPSLKYCTKELKKFLEKEHNIKTVFYSPFKLDRIIKINKDKSRILNNKFVVYTVKCEDCDICYVEQSERLVANNMKTILSIKKGIMM